MIHSPRRLSPKLQLYQDVACDNQPIRNDLVYRPTSRNQSPKIHDDSNNENHRSSGDESVRRIAPRRSQTNSPDRKSRWRSLHPDLIEEQDQKPIKTPKTTLVRHLDLDKTEKSPTSPPSTESIFSCSASCSTVDSSSMVTVDSEHENPSNQEEVTLPPLQYRNTFTQDTYSSELIDENSFDLVAPTDKLDKKSHYCSLETRAELLLSHEHLQVIFNDPSLLLKFTSFLSSHRVRSIPILVYYLDSIKALKAISYSNAIAEALEPISGLDFTNEPSLRTCNSDLEEKSKKSFHILARDDLPAYITHVYTQTVSLSIQRRITGTLPAHLREASEGLAEVFCMTDPSRPDNPIIFSSEEFHRSTQYGITYAIGRNCRFLQGPKTNPFTVKRFREKIDAGEEHSEIILNYRRDGSPFMNLLMCAPLYDSKGKIRYYLGAQVDVSGLVNECSELESFKRLVAKIENPQDENDEPEELKDEFQELSEMLNLQELDTVRRWGGKMHRNYTENDTDDNGNWSKPRLLINPSSPDSPNCPRGFSSPYTRWGGRLNGIYNNYLLVRPYPSMFILFASPSLRVPGTLQSPFMSKIGGSERVREELVVAFADGHGVTAKIKWVSKSDPEGRNRWIHCTPLIGGNGAIGVWMVVIVDDENSNTKRFKRMAPPVDPKIGRVKPTSSHDSSRKIVTGVANRSPMSFGDRNLKCVPDSPYSTTTFDLSTE